MITDKIGKTNETNGILPIRRGRLLLEAECAAWILQSRTPASLERHICCAAAHHTYTLLHHNTTGVKRHMVRGSNSTASSNNTLYVVVWNLGRSRYELLPPPWTLCFHLHLCVCLFVCLLNYKTDFYEIRCNGGAWAMEDFGGNPEHVTWGQWCAK